MRALGSLSLSFLDKLELLTDEEHKELKQYREPILKNHRGIPVGKISTDIDF
ncbi:MAG: hypothetical protein Ct9H300mP29_0180 [Candidatus Neomarinimicrobiota bacterium]|nr:MAG: hypothetical protein Ct9H300mP29_0180 [Candidatus Neomarinimicrobiota bacterium]